MFIDYVKDGPRPIQEVGQKTRVETGTKMGLMGHEQAVGEGSGEAGQGH